MKPATASLRRTAYAQRALPWRRGLALALVLSALLTPAVCVAPRANAQSLPLNQDFDDGQRQGVAITLGVSGAVFLVADMVLVLGSDLGANAPRSEAVWLVSLLCGAVVSLISAAVISPYTQPPQDVPARVSAYDAGQTAGIGDALIGVGSAVAVGGVITIATDGLRRGWIPTAIGAAAIVAGALAHAAGHSDFSDLQRVQSAGTVTMPLMSLSF